MSENTYQNPPRSLSILSKMMILFGGPLQTGAWFFFFMGMLFFWLFLNAEFWGSFIGITFALTGLGGIFWDIRTNVKRIDLLENGVFALSEMSGKTPTNVSINEHTVFEYTYHFSDRNGKNHEVKGRTHKSWLLDSKEYVPVLYDANDPSFAEIYPIIPSAPKIAEDGHLKQVSILNIWKLFLPVLSFIIHGGILIVKYL